jgi:hypothetical protein
MNIFMATTQAARKMIKYLKMNEVQVRTIKIEYLEKIEVNVFEDIREDEDESTKVVKTKKRKMLG